MTRRMIRKSGGVALVTAIFLLVVLAGLAVAVVSLTTSQQSAATQDEQSARAYQAARAGVEWALYVSLRTNGGLANNPLGCPATHTMVMPAQTLSAFTVTVTCGPREAGYGTGNPATDSTARSIRITSVACNQRDPITGTCPNTGANGAPGPDYVQRVIEAQL
jgi:MSHA biogenesis protein MshP